MAMEPSEIVLNPAAQAFVDRAVVTIAPWIEGTLVDMFLNGEQAISNTDIF